MITINMDKAKLIAHQMRRTARQSEFEPLDKLIAIQIPGADVAAIEAGRQAIRDKYASAQVAIDAASDAETLKAVLGGFEEA